MRQDLLRQDLAAGAMAVIFVRAPGRVRAGEIDVRAQHEEAAGLPARAPARRELQHRTLARADLADELPGVAALGGRELGMPAAVDIEATPGVEEHAASALVG